MAPHQRDVIPFLLLVLLARGALGLAPPPQDIYPSLCLPGSACSRDPVPSKITWSGNQVHRHGMANYPVNYDADVPSVNSDDQPTPLIDASSDGGSAPGHEASTMIRKTAAVSRLWPAQWDGALRSVERFGKLRTVGNSKDGGDAAVHGRNPAGIHRWESDLIGRMKSGAGADEVPSVSGAARVQGRTRELMAYLMGQHGDGGIEDGTEGVGELRRGRVEKKGDWENIDMQVWG